MGGIIFPDGYSYLTETIYSNEDKLIKSLKDGKDYVKVTIVDSRGNTSSSSKPLNVEIFDTPYFTSVEATRSNDVDEKVKLKATGKLKYLGKYDVKYIKYWTSESSYNKSDETEGTEYGPFEIDVSKIIYNDEKSEFSLESAIQGDLGAEGFTKGKKFYVKLAIATSININMPKYFYTNIDDGKYIVVFGPDGMEISDIEKINSDTLPIGFEGYYPSSTPPSNWLVEDGRAISRAEYKELFDVIGTTFGQGDGSTTFNLPNKKGRVVVGLDSSQTEFNTLGKTDGIKTVTLNESQLPVLSGSIFPHGYESSTPIQAVNGKFSAGNSNSNYNRGTDSASSSSIGRINWSIGGGQAHSNLQPYIVECAIIKAKNSVPIKSTVVDNFISTSAVDALSSNKGRELYNLVKNRIVYSFPIFGVGSDTVINVIRNSWTDFGTVFYHFKTDIDKIPVQAGYTRYVQIFAILTDNCTNTASSGINIGIFNQSSEFLSRSFEFDIVWGATNNARVNRTSVNKYKYSDMPTGWYRYKTIIPNSQPDGSAGQITYAEIQIIDIKE